MFAVTRRHASVVLAVWTAAVGALTALVIPQQADVVRAATIALGAWVGSVAVFCDGRDRDFFRE